MLCHSFKAKVHNLRLRVATLCTIIIQIIDCRYYNCRKGRLSATKMVTVTSDEWTNNLSVAYKQLWWNYWHFSHKTYRASYNLFQKAQLSVPTHTAFDVLLIWSLVLDVGQQVILGNQIEHQQLAKNRNDWKTLIV